MGGGGCGEKKGRFGVGQTEVLKSPGAGNFSARRGSTFLGAGAAIPARSGGSEERLARFATIQQAWSRLPS